MNTNEQPCIATGEEVKRLRRLAAKQGLKVHRKVDEYGNDGYMLSDVSIGSIVAGGSPIEYSLSYNDVLCWLTEEEAEG